MDFDLLSEIQNIELIARGTGIRIRQYLNQQYGRANWRKYKGFAWIRLHNNGEVQFAEIHWFEAHGIGRRDFKRKQRIRGEL